jgi:23S rRNA pseudouridine1911/1915/1917 synthase
MKTIDFRVEALPDDPRLDKVIPLHAKELSRAKARKLIEAGSVYLNQKRCRLNGKTVALGDKIRLVIAASPALPPPAWDESRILFESSDLLVVNKPPFLPTHETIDSSRFHLVQALQEFLAKRDGQKPSLIYLGIHHRLDRDTSGAILFTKRKEANAAVAQAFQERKVQKTYLALCQGRLPEPVTLRSFLGPSPRNKRVFCSVKKGGKFAETEVRALESRKVGGKVISLVEARPKTGRTHQIRVHLAENGLPILGDKTYGVAHDGAERVMLHAWKLEILGHTFSAPLPDDFRFLDFKEPEA